MAHSEPSNGNHPLDETAVLDVLREAIDQQNVIPAPYVPPAPLAEQELSPETIAKLKSSRLFADELASPARYSSAWFAVQIAANEQIANQMLGQVTGTEVYQAWQRQLGKLENLRELQKLGEA